jgi:hypothetical protein
MLKIQFTFVTRQATLIKWSTVLSLLLVFHAWKARFYHKVVPLVPLLGGILKQQLKE